jgi:exo-1,4-beta-D-glucosaminidase
MDVFNQALNARFGKPENLENYLLKSDAQSYEALKAMFEAFRVNIPKSTGIIQWMLNSAWPSLYWHLYDYYLRPSAAYYAARTANEPVQLMYNYGNNAVYAVNETRHDIKNLVTTLTVMDINSKMLVNKKFTIDIFSNSSINIFKLDPVKGFIFLDLKLEDEKGNRVGGNFYWLSDKPDELAWDKTTWAYTPMKSFTDFSALNHLPATSISVVNSMEETADKEVIHALVSNTSDKIAFFISLSLIDEKGESYCPVFWDDNYFSLLPGETREVKCTLERSILETSNPQLQVSGWNSKTQILSFK